MIDIANKVRADVLAALYNGARSQGLGWLRFTSEPMTSAEAALILKDGDATFDYLDGRVMKVDLSGDTFDPYSYDRDNGVGAAAQAVAQVPDMPTERRKP